ncbi:MAG: ATP-dependent Clp protease ATP-binding subunit [Lachnospiraceae bacterium]|nr:ATP-dependent Clp protease ATP-binding subunit [Lachnospiraceae bacterium]
MARKYTEKAWMVLTTATKRSESLGHGYVGSEHLLLALCGEEAGVAAMVLAANDIDEEKVMRLIDEQIALPGKVAKKERSGFTPKVESILDLAQELAHSFDSDEIGTEHILLAIISDGDNLALRLLNTLSVNAQKLFADTLVAMGENLEDYKEQIRATARHADNMQGMLIDRYSRDLTALASEGKLDPVIGRDIEITRMIQTLSRRTKNNPCLIGEPGVGKTAIVEGLAQRIADGAVPDTVADKRLLTLDLSAMVAGSKYRGEFEERIKRVISEVISEGNILLFMDEVHTIIGAGGAEGSIDASNILKPSLARGEVQLIGATTYDEYRKHIEKDAALERRFQPIYVEEPSEEDCISILRGIAPAYEKHHCVKYDDDALVAAVKLSARYISDRFLPDKAIDLIDEAASKVRLSALADPKDINDLKKKLSETEKEEEACLRANDIEGFSAKKKEAEKIARSIEKKTARIRERSDLSVTKTDVEGIVASLTKIPTERLSESESSKLLKLESELSRSVIGQQEAVGAVSRAIKRGRVGLKEANRPIGSFLFLGPTGVGKTELSKTLARTLFGTENALIRVDMSEYMEKHTVSKMIGSPPGYVGFEEGGQLSEKVRRNPYSVVLFDEIEKAHPDVFNILLQVLDDGHITDSNGRKVSFKNTIIIMTSNAGANRIIDPKKLGFVTQTDEKSDHERMRSGVMEEVKNTFKPEFINRIDEIVVFRTLNDDDLKKIVSIQTKLLCERALEARGIKLKITDSAKKLVAAKGTDKKFGARPIKRAVQTMIEDPLSLEILEGKFKEGDTVTARAKSDKIIFSVD